MEGDHGIFDCDRTFFTELAESARHGLTRGASHGGHLFVREEEREAIAAIHVLADLVRKFEKEASETACNGFCERDAACVLEGETIFLTDALDGTHLCLTMIAQEGEKSLAFDGAELC